jgi:hypothetical protein
MKYSNFTLIIIYVESHRCYVLGLIDVRDRMDVGGESGAKSGVLVSLP